MESLEKLLKIERIFQSSRSSEHSRRWGSGWFAQPRDGRSSQGDWLFSPAAKGRV